MVILSYDHTLEGFLTAVFDIYALKIKDPLIRKRDQYAAKLFAEEIYVVTDEGRAERVLNKLKKCLTKQSLKALLGCFLSEIEDIEDCVFSVIQHALKSSKPIHTDYAHPDVLRMTQIERQLHREKHRMEAFVRFRLTKDGIYYAEIEPDFNVLPLIEPHFKDRYADQKWLIFDLKRQYGLFYNLHHTEFITMPSRVKYITKDDFKQFEEGEEQYQVLWKDYFENVNIKARKNTSLHVRHIPYRYWKYLTEK